MMTKIKKIFLFLVIGYFLLLPAVTYGADPFSFFSSQIGIGKDAEAVASYQLSPQQEIVVYVAAIVRITLAFLGVAFLIVTVYAGFRWMTAGGNEEQITEAKSLLRNGAIGVAIVVMAYVISYFAVMIIGGQFYGVMDGGSFSTTIPPPGQW